jgi:predicted transcriptional regulator
VFVLGKMEGRTRAEIALILGVSECTVRESMRQAIKTVKNYIISKWDIQVPGQERGTVLKKTNSVWAGLPGIKKVA